MDNRRPIPQGSRRSMAGVSLVEMMIAVTLGLLILAALASIFASSSASRNEIERNSRQIENGRFAIETLSEELRLAGFYGELNTGQVNPPGAIPDPCSGNPADWQQAIRMHVYGWDEGLNVPPCVQLPNHKPRTDVLMIRRVSTCEAGKGSCDPLDKDKPYIQVSRCATQMVKPGFAFKLQPGASTFDLQNKDCTTASGLRRYFVRFFYVAMDNGTDPIPSLKRVDFDGADFTDPVTLVEGIEELNIEYGIDWGPVVGVLAAPDGQPEGYSTDPATYADPACGAFCNPLANWLNATTARIHILARNIEPSPDYVDKKVYTLGTTNGGGPYNVAPGGNYRRHAYSSLVRVVNAAQRRETPP